MTCIPMRRGFLYLVASMDWRPAARYWPGDCHTLDADLRRWVLAKAIAYYESPEIFNTDQG